MSLHDRIKEARKQKGITQTELGELIGVAKTTIAGYEKNREPTAAQLGAIADILDVDVTFLLQDEIRIRHDTRATLDEMENLVKKYRSLDPHGQETVDAILGLEYKRCLEQEKAKMDVAEIAGDVIRNIIPFRRSYQPASAGTGMYLGPDEFETIYVQENDLTRRASFGIPVRGDSMEPDYHDGDVLLVERAEDIRIGQVGVFTIDGEGFVKERGDGELISLNPKYKPVSMNKSIRCNGRVIGILEPEWIVEK